MNKQQRDYEKAKQATEIFGCTGAPIPTTTNLTKMKTGN